MGVGRRRRFEREARLAAALSHPNIATIHGRHEQDGIHFLAMELVEAKQSTLAPLSASSCISG